MSGCTWHGFIFGTRDFFNTGATTMKSLVIGFLILTSTAFAQNPILPPKPKSACEVCDQVKAMDKAADENETKVAAEYAKYMSTLQFSKDKKTRAQEFKAVLTLAARLVEKDEQFEIAQYLVGVKNEDPKLYTATVKALSESQRKTLNHWEPKMRKLFEKGEEP